MPHQFLVRNLHGEVLDEVDRGWQAGERERAQRDAATLAPLSRRRERDGAHEDFTDLDAQNDGPFILRGRRDPESSQSTAIERSAHFRDSSSGPQPAAAHASGTLLPQGQMPCPRGHTETNGSRETQSGATPDMAQIRGQFRRSSNKRRPLGR